MSLPLLDIGSVVAIVGSAISVIKLFLEQRKARKDIELGLKKSGSTWFRDEEEFFKLIALRIRKIVQEIYKIHEMGIEIYPQKTKK